MPGPLSNAVATHSPDQALVRAPMFHSETLAGALVLDATYPKICKLDPGGANRDVTLDAIATNAGLFRSIINAADAAENLVVKNPAGSTIGTVNQNEQGDFYCDGSTWTLVAIRTIALS